MRILLNLLLFALPPVTLMAAHGSLAQAADLEPKAQMIANIQHWVGLQEGVTATAVEVQANDRRFIVPKCDADFEVDFAFASKSNVQVNCVSLDWQAILRIQIREQADSLTYARALSQGAAVTERDLLPVRSSTALGLAPLSDPAQAIGRLLKVSVSEGQLVRLNHFDDAIPVFVALRDIAQGETLSQSLFDSVLVASSGTDFDERFTQGEIANAVAIRDVERGARLSLRDFSQTSAAIVVTSLIERGGKFDPSNSQSDVVRSRLPADAVIDFAQLGRAVSKRRLTPGSIVRFSDIAIQPHVVADTTTTLRLSKQKLTLTMDVFALDDGFLGDRIRVRNQESGETLYATVVDVGLVEIVGTP